MTYPDSWTLAAVKQVKLDSSLVDDPSGESIEGINLSEYRPLAYTSKARVAGACAQIIDFRGDERRVSAASRRCRACLGAGVATANDDNIIWPAEMKALLVRDCFSQSGLKSYGPRVARNSREVAAPTY